MGPLIYVAICVGILIALFAWDVARYHRLGGEDAYNPFPWLPTKCYCGHTDRCDCAPLSELHTLENTDVQVTNVHYPARCAGRTCTIHNRTDHHMRSWPQHFRADRGVMERICEHGIGHPDPDDIDWRPSTQQGWVEGQDTVGVHGCDGCCGKEET